MIIKIFNVNVMGTDNMKHWADIMIHCVYHTMKTLLTSPITYTCIDMTILKTRWTKKLIESKN